MDYLLYNKSLIIFVDIPRISYVCKHFLLNHLLIHMYLKDKKRESENIFE